MGWLSALTSYLNRELHYPRDEVVKGSVGVQLRKQQSGRHRPSVSGGVSARRGPLTSSVSVKVSDKGKVSARAGQQVAVSIGGHKLKLGASVGSGGEVKTQLGWSTRLPERRPEVDWGALLREHGVRK